MIGDELLKSVAVSLAPLRPRHRFRRAARRRRIRHRADRRSRTPPRSPSSSHRIFEAIRAPYRMPRPSGHHRRQHRHRAGAAGRLRSRPDPEERRSGDVCRQGRRPPHLSLLRAGHGRPGPRPPHPGNRTCARRSPTAASRSTTSLVSACSDNRITGCEALLRWRHPQRGMISPAEFIPIAEETGLINQLGEWVLTTACAEAATWPDHIRLAVNVSPVQFRSGTLALKVMAALAASGLAAEPAGARDHRSRADPRRRGGAGHPAPAARHRGPDRAGRFRHRLFLAELSAALPVRQDQDRPLLRHRHRRARRLVLHRRRRWSTSPPTAT